MKTQCVCVCVSVLWTFCFYMLIACKFKSEFVRWKCVYPLETLSKWASCAGMYPVVFNMHYCAFSKFNGKRVRLQGVFYKRSPLWWAPVIEPWWQELTTDKSKGFFFPASIWLLVACVLFTECCITSCNPVICLQKHYFPSFHSNKQWCVQTEVHGGASRLNWPAAVRRCW